MKFQLNDLVYLEHMEMVVKLQSKFMVEQANNSPEGSVRLATDYEIQEGF